VGVCECVNTGTFHVLCLTHVCDMPYSCVEEHSSVRAVAPSLATRMLHTRV